MRKNVMIRLTSVQRDESGEDEKISLETPGIYGEEEGYSFVTYEETGLAGLEGTTTKLVCYPRRAVLSRSGNFLYEQEYVVGKTMKSYYDTPMGPLDLIVTTKEFTNTVVNGNGKIRIVYDVELEGIFKHLNEIIIDVWEDIWKSEMSLKN